jgi:hypothetical protein
MLTQTDPSIQTPGPNSILVRLSCEPAAELSAQIDSILNTFSSMGAVVLSAVVQGSRVRTTLDVTDPKPGVISELILHLARLGRVRVITQADRDED